MANMMKCKIIGPEWCSSMEVTLRGHSGNEKYNLTDTYDCEILYEWDDGDCYKVWLPEGDFKDNLRETHEEDELYFAFRESSLLLLEPETTNEQETDDD